MLALFALPVQVWADTFFVVRGDSMGGNATNLYTWDDVANIETFIAANTYVGAPFTGQEALVDGLALHPTTGILYGFVVDDTTNATLVPVDPNTQTAANSRAQLVTVNTATGEVTPVVLANWNDGLAIYGAAFDPAGNLWAVDMLADQVLRIDLVSGLAVAGTAVPVGVNVGISVDLAFTANGVGVLVNGDFDFYVFDSVLNTVTPLTAALGTPVGFDSGLVPPFSVAGVAFTTHLATRNLDPNVAQICRLNLYEGRQQDQYGHANDPFHTNSIVAYADPNAGDINSGPGDMASDVFPNCLFNFGDAPASYEARTPARHGLSPNVKLGALSDAENGPLSSTNADGDDTADADDENGIGVVPPFNVGTGSYSVQVVISNTTGSTARLCGYLDAGDGAEGFNGLFNSSDERACVNVPSAAGPQVAALQLEQPGVEHNGHRDLSAAAVGHSGGTS